MACDAFSVHIYKMKSTAYLCNCSTAQPNIHNLCEILNILSIQRAIKDCRRGLEQKVIPSFQFKCPAEKQTSKQKSPGDFNSELLLTVKGFFRR